MGWSLPPQRCWVGNLEKGAEPSALAEVPRGMMPSLGKGSRSPSDLFCQVKSWPPNWAMRADPLWISCPRLPAQGRDGPGLMFSSQCVKLILEANHEENTSPTAQSKLSGLDFFHKNLKNSKDQIYFLTRGLFKDHRFLSWHLCKYAGLLLQFNWRPLGPTQSFRHAWLF